MEMQNTAVEDDQRLLLVDDDFSVEAESTALAARGLGIGRPTEISQRASRTLVEVN